jgi:2-polyprenyl-6-hydroxyphenyl methylase/3-demethylubiquinone-9 3-methyltransferase
MTNTTHQTEIMSGNRFAFGENWANFLKSLDERRIDEAVRSLMKMLEAENLEGKTFIDIGSGSGLFSLAARKLGAKVFSFDYDPKSVACTNELKRRYFPDDFDWTVETGSALDREYLESLGRFDIVYSWGVLHHTGDLWSALDNVDVNVMDFGVLFLALYNDQGRHSKLWWAIKKTYVSLPSTLRWIVLLACYVRLWGPTMIIDMLKLKPFKTWRDYRRNRGMSPHRDVIDWVGGFPFEVSKPEDIFNFYKSKGYVLSMIKTCGGGLGCNEYVFRKTMQTSPVQKHL